MCSISLPNPETFPPTNCHCAEATPRSVDGYGGFGNVGVLDYKRLALVADNGCFQGFAFGPFYIDCEVSDSVYPFSQITPESEFYAPAVNSMKLRGDASTGWSMGWKANLWARLLNGDRAHGILKTALRHSTSFYVGRFRACVVAKYVNGFNGVCKEVVDELLGMGHTVLRGALFGRVKDSGQTKGWTCYTENNIFGGVGSFMHNYVIANAW